MSRELLPPCEYADLPHRRPCPCAPTLSEIVAWYRTRRRAGLSVDALGMLVGEELDRLAAQGVRRVTVELDGGCGALAGSIRGGDALGEDSDDWPPVCGGCFAVGAEPHDPHCIDAAIEARIYGEAEDDDSLEDDDEDDDEPDQ